MLDGTLRPKIDPVLNAIARSLAANGITANTLTTVGLLIGVLAGVAIFFEYYLVGLVLLLTSRLCDGLDGALARISGSSDFGGYIDIVFDFAFYGLIPLAFILANPSANAVAGGVLIFSFYVNGASFLAFAIMAEKQQLKTEKRGKKSFFFTTGLAEATETFAVFSAFCLLPTYFSQIAYVFAAVVLYTAAVRIGQAKNLLN
ncbi:CDP-alcohol phosphatidyltransferase family protein [Ahrensia sp. 13_GOM-1096m]|uniref:CDP-alcohol phosphatidyltransferase family protein n=1 Tax=Ahrensia sp. 13_GOM-1096m TaxID=1380380 RepID=UPI00047BA0F2|nr:CDP-alcohol phosphatidyltransferase family protein [Ahrensia sp. 13_GOM-1096m]